MQRLTGQVQNYAWGSPTTLPKLLGLPSDGRPQAEYWLGAHPSAPSRADSGPLDALLTSEPGLIGAASVQRFGPQLPFLLKLLAADQPLSLQVHPSREQAEAGFAKEDADGVERSAPNRNYRDDWPKPEAMVALEDFHGLYGFRDAGDSYRLFRALEVPELSELIEPLRSPGGALGIEETFLSCLRLGQDELWLVGRVVEAARRLRRTEDAELALFCRTARELAEHHPGDPGVLAGLLCNRILIRPGESVFLRAGLMHAYLRGSGVEIMANSDNVLRGGLTAKHIDIDELARIVDFHPAPPEIIPGPDDDVPVWRYPTEAPEFSLWRLLPLDQPTSVPAQSGARVVVCVDGSLRLHSDDADLELDKGQSAFLAAEEPVQFSGHGLAFVGAPGV